MHNEADDKMSSRIKVGVFNLRLDSELSLIEITSAYFFIAFFLFLDRSRDFFDSPIFDVVVAIRREKHISKYIF